MIDQYAFPKGFTFTQSSLESYLACKRLFQLRYIQKLVWPAPITADARQFEADKLAGIQFHMLAHQYFLGVEPELLRQVARNNPDNRVAGWLEAFLNHYQGQFKGLCLPEKTLFVTLGDHTLAAKYDLLQWTGQEVIIHDWKTSNLPSPVNRQQLKSRLAARMQTRVFPLVAWLTGWPGETVETQRKLTLSYWEARDPENSILFTYDEAKADTDSQLIIKLIDEISATPAGQFHQTNDEKRCVYCAFRSYCRRGIEAGSYEEGWEQNLLVEETWADLLEKSPAEE